MIIDVSNLFGNKEKSIPLDLSIDISDTESYPDIVEFLEPVKVKGTLTKFEDIITLNASGESFISICCDRCLIPVNVKLNFNINDMFSKTGNIDKDIEAVKDNVIDLYQCVKNAIFESIPMKVLCFEGCKGLCSQCGKNFNEGKCNCSTTYINPKLSSLRVLFNIDEEV